MACSQWCKLKAVLEVADVAEEVVEDVARSQSKLRVPSSCNKKRSWYIHRDVEANHHSWGSDEVMDVVVDIGVL
jgi:hypothetical protein